MNITVRNVPDTVYESLKRQAKRNNRSLNAEIIRVIEVEAGHAGRSRDIQVLSEKLKRFRKTRFRQSDSATMIRWERDRH